MDLKHHNNFMTPNDNLMFLESVIFRKPKNDTPTKQQTALQPLTQQKNLISKNKLHKQPIFFKLTQRTQHTPLHNQQKNKNRHHTTQKHTPEHYNPTK